MVPQDAQSAPGALAACALAGRRARQRTVFPSACCTTCIPKCLLLFGNQAGRWNQFPVVPSSCCNTPRAAPDLCARVRPVYTPLQIGKIGDTPKPLPTFEARIAESGEIEVNV